MLHSVDYAAILQYSPRGNSELAIRSRGVKDANKKGSIEDFRTRLAEIFLENNEKLEHFLNRGSTLVPAPRSSPIRESDLWPALEIVKMLCSLNLGKLAKCLLRQKAIKKSALYFSADDRPSIQEQYDSLTVENMPTSSNITLVDDVLTLGRTTIAGASRLAEKFPDSTIRIFSLIQTKPGESEIESILNVETGIIIYNQQTGKCRRNPN
jgi:hypothetical protein